ncbi:MAG: hypothetical protein HYX92_11855 [Chloroflexi bacterium]|nr:hypothetical protein [Chloroflexota bacterium]
MSQQELLRGVVAALDRAGIDYMVTGSVASSLHGEPRSTHDVDLLVAIDVAAAGELLKTFPPPRYYLDPEAIRDATATKSMFNLLDTQTGDKVDFWVLTDEPFDKSRFARKYQQEFMGIRLNVPTPEDAILAKLWWANQTGGSEKQFADALRIYESQAGKLDLDYLREWIGKLRLVSLWERLLKEADTQ